MSRKQSERFYSKLEVFCLRFIFRDLVESIQNNPRVDPKDLAAQSEKYKRDLLRASFGIQRLLFTKKEDHCLITVGLEDRQHNYTIKVDYKGEVNED